MTAPVPDARVYADFAGLDALKRSAKSNDPAAVRQVAKQLESVFARMMIKSMRDAVGTDPIFGSDEEKTYQGMFDDQLSVDMTRGRGLGLADMLVHQLQRLGAAGANGAPSNEGGARAPAAAATAAPPTAASGPTAAERESFVRDLWPDAQQAGQQLGVDPRNLIAQAALETNWGKSMPRDANGTSSNNLFGVKAGGPWTGGSVTADTQEYQAGTAVNTAAQFRSYDNRAQSLQNYVQLIRGNARYAGALNTGSNVQAFATALQRGGYATDPQYARKVSAVASTVAATMAAAASQPQLSGADGFKVDADLPMTGANREL